MIDDLDAPRSMTITVTDLGDSWDVTIRRNRVHRLDPDVCELLAQFDVTTAQLHHEAHIAKELHEHRN